MLAMCTASHSKTLLQGIKSSEDLELVPSQEAGWRPAISFAAQSSLTKNIWKFLAILYLVSLFVLQL